MQSFVEHVPITQKLPAICLANGLWIPIGHRKRYATIGRRRTGNIILKPLWRTEKVYPYCVRSRSSENKGWDPREICVAANGYHHRKSKGNNGCVNTIHAQRQTSKAPLAWFKLVVIPKIFVDHYLEWNMDIAKHSNVEYDRRMVATLLVSTTEISALVSGHVDDGTRHFILGTLTYRFHFIFILFSWCIHYSWVFEGPNQWRRFANGPSGFIHSNNLPDIVSK